jgi:hypothetical protein
MGLLGFVPQPNLQSKIQCHYGSIDRAELRSELTDWCKQLIQIFVRLIIPETFLVGSAHPTSLILLNLKI